jgi:hypothetical protein
MDLTTKARVKALLELTTTTGDALIDQLIPAVSLQVEKYLGFSTTGGAETDERIETYDVMSGDYVFWTRSFPIDLEEDFEARNAFDRDFDNADAISESLYQVEASTGRVVFDRYGIIPGAGVLQLTYTAGLGASAAEVITDHPDIATAVDIQTAFLFKRKDTMGLSSFGTDGASVGFFNPDELLPTVKAMLDGRRRILV